MDNNESEFMKILKTNDKEKLREYILENGKEGKPYCPISFNLGEQKDVRDEEIT